MCNVTVAYEGSAPGADTNTYELFNTITAGFGGALMQMTGLKRYVLDLKNSQAGTLNVSKSNDRGTTWTVVSTTAVSAAASNDTNLYDVYVEPYKDFKVEWVNGGSAQATWVIDQALSNERGPAA